MKTIKLLKTLVCGLMLLTASCTFNEKPLIQAKLEQSKSAKMRQFLEFGASWENGYSINTSLADGIEDYQNKKKVIPYLSQVFDALYFDVF